MDEVKEFPTHDEAVQFCKDYNNKYNPPLDEAPSWYMYACVDGDSSIGMLR